MKKILIMLLAIVAIFCTFVGCDDNKASTGNNGGTIVTDDTKNGENSGKDKDIGVDTSKYDFVAPISNGGDFTGADYE